MAPVAGTNISMSRLALFGGSDPLLISNDLIPRESIDTQQGFTRVEWKKGGGRREVAEESALVSMCVCVHGRDLLLSIRHSFGHGCSTELLGSTDMPCLDAWPHSYSLACIRHELLLLE